MNFLLVAVIIVFVVLTLLAVGFIISMLMKMKKKRRSKCEDLELQLDGIMMSSKTSKGSMDIPSTPDSSDKAKYKRFKDAMLATASYNTQKALCCKIREDHLDGQRDQMLSNYLETRARRLDDGRMKFRNCKFRLDMLHVKDKLEQMRAKFSIEEPKPFEPEEMKDRLEDGLKKIQDCKLQLEMLQVKSNSILSISDMLQKLEQLEGKQ